MTTLPLSEKDWMLALVVDSDFDIVMSWFPDKSSLDRWSGPNFRYPFTGKTFREDCRLDMTTSYVLWQRDGEMAAFGQSYNRDGRGHLARLVVNPAFRGQGVGKQLIRMIIAALAKENAYAEYSLFVYRDNQPAYQCYLSLGFVVVDYPDDAPMPDKCFFLTRKANYFKNDS